MPSFPPFAARPLDPVDHPAAIALAALAGVQGVYISNVLHQGSDGGQMLGLHGLEELLGLVYFGRRGNLLVLEAQPLDPALVARAVLAALWQWRIALAPPEVVAQLVAQGQLRGIVNRRQIYYGVTGAQLLAVPARGGMVVRAAERRDLKPLVEASLHLNQTDLHIDPWRVDRDWLRRTTKTRIKQSTTFVLGPAGRPVAKLDVGSSGVAGLVIEGVYTWPQERGRGHAAALVAGVAAEVLRHHPLVCLHVAASNSSARRAYEKCGMVELADCQLLLRD